jgi:hypothetical protein
MNARALEAKIRQAAVNRILDNTESRRRFCASEVTVVRMHGGTFMLQCDIWQKTPSVCVARHAGAAEENPFYLVAAETFSAFHYDCAVSGMSGTSR